MVDQIRGIFQKRIQICIQEQCHRGNIRVHTNIVHSTDLNWRMKEGERERNEPTD